MAQVIERNGRFMARVRREGRTATKTFAFKKDAAAWARRTEADIEAGRFVDVVAEAAAAAVAAEATEAASAALTASAVPTMLAALKAYRLAVVPGLKGADTYSYWLDEFERAPMAAKPVDQVSPFDLAGWRDEQCTTLAAGTVARKLGLLGGFFSWARTERGWVKTNPLNSVRKPRVSDARDRVLTDEERRYLLAAAATSRADWLADVLVVLLQSAMRRGELWGLQRADVDYSLAVAHLADTKNGSARDVPLCPLALAALRRLDAAAADAGRSALVPLSDPHAVSVAFRRTLERARRQYATDTATAGGIVAAGFLADVRLHDCRHVAVSHWAAAGLGLFELQQVSGHKTTKMLARYVNLKASTLACKLATLSA